MTWISEKKLTWYESLCMNVLKTGQVPRHIAFIMDGNRRFAKRNNMAKTEGHARGFTKLSETLKWCRDLGVTEVTVYAFSIENFRRPQEEIDGIMELARDKFRLLLQEKDKLAEHGVCIRFIGDLSLLPEDIQKQIAEVMLMTRYHSAARLNIAFSYTAREEISRAVRDTAAGVAADLLQPSDVTEHLLEQCLYTRDSPRPDLLVRTSGEVRLSDFLLWQTTYSCIYFTKVLWPDFSIWHLFAAVFSYQRYYMSLQVARADQSAPRLQHLPPPRVDDSGCESSADSTDSDSVPCAPARTLTPDTDGDTTDSARSDTTDSDTADGRCRAFLRRLDFQRWQRLEELVLPRSTRASDRNERVSPLKKAASGDEREVAAMMESTPQGVVSEESTGDSVETIGGETHRLLAADKVPGFSTALDSMAANMASLTVNGDALSSGSSSEDAPGVAPNAAEVERDRNGTLSDQISHSS